MFLMPDVKAVKVNSETTVLVYFSSGIIKVFDLTPLLHASQTTLKDIKVDPEGAILNNTISISDYDLWAKSTFYGWDRT